ncbi:MAG TPA: orotate phosphoribosyltransferase [Elusimicrobia bacterium]|nr:orotate phosphoribosyltransferase [Elusimicrobiota bacterium]
MNKLDVIGILQEHGAIVSGHFRLPSGLHSPTFIQAAVVLQYPHLAQKIAKAMSAKFPSEADVVIAPAVGGVVIGQEVARVRKCRSIFTERVGGAMSLGREFQLSPGERVLVVEDVLTTGHTTSEVVALAQAYGAKVVGVAAILDRSTTPLPIPVPIRALVSYPVKVAPPDACELCARQVPLSRLGRKDILDFLQGE